MIVNFTEHAANERTFLAWVRTAVAIMGFGLAVARLGTDTISIWSEVLMFASGAVVILLAYIRMRHLGTMIEAATSIDVDHLPSNRLLLLLLVALFALLVSFVVHVG